MAKAGGPGWVEKWAGRSEVGAYKSTGKEPVSGAWSAHVLHSVAQVPVYCPYINTPKAAKGHQQKRRERAASPLLRVNSRSHVSGLQNTGPGLGSPQPPKAGKRFEKRSGVFRKRSGFLQTKGQNGEISQTPASFKKLRNFQNFQKFSSKIFPEFQKREIS